MIILKVFIILFTVKEFLSDFTLLFLLDSQQTRHKFDCNTLYTEISWHEVFKMPTYSATPRTIKMSIWTDD
jgi:hypothetical protein